MAFFMNRNECTECTINSDKYLDSLKEQDKLLDELIELRAKVEELEQYKKQTDDILEIKAYLDNLDEVPAAVDFEKLNAFSIEREYIGTKDEVTIIGYKTDNGSCEEWHITISRAAHDAMVEQFANCPNVINGIV